MYIINQSLILVYDCFSFCWHKIFTVKCTNFRVLIIACMLVTHKLFSLYEVLLLSFQVSCLPSDASIVLIFSLQFCVQKVKNLRYYHTSTFIHTHTHTEYMAYVQCMYTHKSRSTDVWIREETFYSLVVILVSLSCTSVPYEGDNMRVSATCISWGMGSCNTGEELLLNE